MKSSLYTCIQDIQNGDREQALALLEKFSPLLKKYAFFMQSEDALPDFQCFLLAFAKNLQLDKLTIGYVGHTGCATRKHLHLDVWINGSRVDAMQYFSL